jgi:glycosyltransferase involved in cell wall biosynthesis
VNRYFQHQTRNFSPYQLWGVVMMESWLRKHPAVLPSASPEPRAPRKPPEPVLDAVSVAPSIFLVAEGTDAPGVDPLKNPAFNEMLTPSVARMMELAETVEYGAGPSKTQVLKLPFWGQEARWNEVAGADALKGATLIFAELGALPRFDHAEYRKLKAAGVRRVLLPNLFRPEELFELEFNEEGPVGRWIGLTRLFQRRVAGVAASSKLRKLLRLEPFHMAEGHVKTHALNGIEAVPDTDITSRYALFEGHAQMLPLEGRQDQLSEQSGRYSVWNQTLSFAPIARERLAKLPYWVVPVDERTTPHLPIRVTHHKARPSAAEARADIERILSRLAGSDAPVNLRPGDRVVVHTHGLPPGGAERQWLYLAQTLKEAGYDVVFVTSHSVRGANGHYLPDLARTGIRHVDATSVGMFDRLVMLTKYPVLRDLAGGWVANETAAARVAQLAAVFDQLRPKVVFTQLDEPNILAGLAALTVKVPRVVLSFRNYNPTHFPYLDSPWLLPCYRLLARSPQVIFSGNFVGANEDYAQWIGIDPARVAHVPNVIEPERFPPATESEAEGVRAQLDMKEGDELVLGVFRLSAEKDPFLFLDVCVRLCRERDNIVCAIAGIGKLKDALLDQIDQAGLGDRIRLLGSRRDVNVLMSVASVLLQTPEHEGMPNAVMEAQLLGLPVVSTTAGGTADVVVHGETGILAPIGDAEALLQACRALLDDPAKASAMGQAGRKRVLTEFRKEELAQRYLGIVDPGAAPPASAAQHRRGSSAASASPIPAAETQIR